MLKQKFNDQVKLLLLVLPEVAKEACFALKGGTAINLFVRDFPRLSVDIDLTYIGDEPRDEALRLTEEALYRIQTNIEKRFSNIKIHPSSRDGLNRDIKLFVTQNQTQIKIEANPVIRGTLFPVEVRPLSPKVVNEFETEFEIQIAAISDLYGGKIAAALDRQHPRDLFDIKLLSENEGISEETKDGFIVYLLSHKRPPYEILYPTKKDMRDLFKNEFEGMSSMDFNYDDFEKARDWLIKKVDRLITKRDRDFLVSFFDGTPDWKLFKYPDAQNLPAVKWKLQNINKMSNAKKNQQLKELKTALEIKQI
jgi:predicted nucleotidyltransferase component of viral defense system